MNNFAAIDFETANGKRTSVCSIGVVIVRDGVMAGRFHEYIHPTPNYYSHFTTAIHGITRSDTDEAQLFPEVWELVLPLIEGLPLVAHNSPFDEGCLKAVHLHYGMHYPQYLFYCTCRAARRALPGLANYRLPTVAAHIGYDLTDHHNALADAEACAAIAKLILP